MSFKGSRKANRDDPDTVPIASHVDVGPYWDLQMDEANNDTPGSARRRMEPEVSHRGIEDVVPDPKIKELILYHLKDWLVIGLCIVGDAVLNVIHPFYRYVGQTNIDDYHLPHKKNTVPLWSVPLIAIGIPLSVFCAFFLKRRNVRDFHHAVLGLLTAVGVSAVFTDTIKNGVGRARPDFYWRCFPDGVENFTGQYGEVVCHGDASAIREGHKSFPSGHTSWSFAGLGYLSFYLMGKVTFLDKRGFSSRVLLVFFPLLLAALVAVSRVSDYWHHWQDVTVGGLLGLVIAYFTYKQHFPDFSDKMAALPHPHIFRPKPQMSAMRSNREQPQMFAMRPNREQPMSRANGPPFDVEAAEM